jgi:hypothetical protein
MEYPWMTCVFAVFGTGRLAFATLVFNILWPHKETTIMVRKPYSINVEVYIVLDTSMHRQPCVMNPRTNNEIVELKCGSSGSCFFARIDN